MFIENSDSLSSSSLFIRFKKSFISGDLFRYISLLFVTFLHLVIEKRCVLYVLYDPLSRHIEHHLFCVFTGNEFCGHFLEACVFCDCVCFPVDSFTERVDCFLISSRLFSFCFL